MTGSTRIGTVSGIGIFVHWSFSVMLAGLFAFYLWRGASVGAALVGIVLILAVFFCVILHELGHAFAARAFGIPTLDITMYPIGGVARLQRIPARPREELLIALAGPAVNAAIAVALALLGGAARGPGAVLSASAGLLPTLMWLNLALLAFNMIPAFPLDGGRVLRAGLATLIDYRRATHIASLVGHVIAVIMAAYGFATWNPTLPFIALFIVVAARQEVAYVMEKA